MAPIRFSKMLCTALALAGCGATLDNTSPGTMAQATCRAAGAEGLLGQPLDQQVLQQALATSGGLRSRVVRPGAAVTMDADPMRLNIEVDETGHIRRMVCG